MHFISSNWDNRLEKRFHPVSEKVSWRKIGCPWQENCELVDVSQNGLSFSTEMVTHHPLERGDTITVRNLGFDYRPVHYAVAWESRRNGRVATGLTRLSSSAETAKPQRYPFHHSHAGFQARVAQEDEEIGAAGDTIWGGDRIRFRARAA